MKAQNRDADASEVTEKRYCNSCKVHKDIHMFKLKDQLTNARSKSCMKCLDKRTAAYTNGNPDAKKAKQLPLSLESLNQNKTISMTNVYCETKADFLTNEIYVTGADLPLQEGDANIGVISTGDEASVNSAQGVNNSQGEDEEDDDLLNYVGTIQQLEDDTFDYTHYLANEEDGNLNEETCSLTINGTTTDMYIVEISEDKCTYIVSKKKPTITNTTHQARLQLENPTLPTINSYQNDQIVGATSENPNVIGYDKELVKDLINENLVSKIEELTGFKWRIRTTNFRNRYCYYYLVCSQDNDHIKEEDRHESNPNACKRAFFRYSSTHCCKSKCSISVDLINKDIKINFNHDTHEAPIESHQKLSKDHKTFIYSHLQNFPAASANEVFAALRSMFTHERDTISYKSVLNHFTKCSKVFWQRDENHLESLNALADEHHTVEKIDFRYAKNQASGFLIHDTIKNLLPYVECLAIDSTYNLASDGLQLFVVLGIVDGHGYPLMYWYSKQSYFNINYLALTQLRAHMLPRSNENLIFLSDKDEAQSKAIATVFPSFKVNICHWHMCRAISTIISQNTAKPTDNYLRLAQEQKLPAFLKDETFGLNTNPQRLGGKKLGTEVKDFIYHLSKEHQLLRGSIIFGLSVEESYEILTKKTFEYCKTKNLELVWQYLYVNWFTWKEFQRWSIATDALHYNHYKTTMLVEGHWSALKRRFLKDHCRPRIDFNGFRIIHIVIPHFVLKMQMFINKSIKTLPQLRDWGASWRIDLYKNFLEFKKSRNWSMIDTTKYGTKLSDWTCGCQEQKNNRFTICKHLWKLLNLPSNNYEFFINVTRHSQIPLLRHHLIQRDGINQINQLDINSTELENFNQELENAELIENNQMYEEEQALKFKNEIVLEKSLLKILVNILEVTRFIDESMDCASFGELERLSKLFPIILPNKTLTSLLLHLKKMMKTDTFQQIPKTWTSGTSKVAKQHQTNHLRVLEIVNFINSNEELKHLKW